MGEFVDEYKNGYGSYIWANGDRYIGQFLNDVRSGYGEYYYSNGDKYVGDHANDTANGIGIYYFADGDTYEGEMLNGQFHGRGKYVYSDGRVETGFWEYNVYVVSDNDKPKTNSTISSMKLCETLGFSKGTAEFRKCVLEVMKN